MEQGDSGLNIVWFKRDLRVQDHEPLAAAAAQGPVLPVYIVEPEYWLQPTASLRQWKFLRQSVESLAEQLASLGQPLWVLTGNAPEILHRLIKAHSVCGLYSHMETGDGWTFARDRAVQALDVPWYEYRQHGVVRGLKARSGWASQWEALMAMPKAATPVLSGPGPGPFELPETLPTACTLDIEVQEGGSGAGHALLESFLTERGREYTRQMSSPDSAAQACSRLSPHLALGTLSLRGVVQRLRSTHAEDSTWARSYRSLDKRLHWHCHFMQKLESEPRMEFEALHRGFTDLHTDPVDGEVVERWIEGYTGWPFVDACMRCLKHTGWINFRMRAMLVSLSAYHLWQPWQVPAQRLAQRFVDYEPGIHYSQIQMQSGTTGINVNRMYNPIKQSRDQDPEGDFIRRWVPELAGYSNDWIHEPWRAPVGLQRRMGGAVMAPIADPVLAARQAKQRLTDFIRAREMRDEAQRVLTQHGSRMRQSRPKYSSGSKDTPQQTMDF